MTIVMKVGASSNPTEATEKNLGPGLQSSRNFKLE